MAHLSLDSPQAEPEKGVGSSGLIGGCPRKQEWKSGPGVGSEIGKEEEPI